MAFFVAILLSSAPAVRVGKRQQVALEALHFGNVDVVQVAVGARKDHQHLLFDRQRRELILLEQLRQALAARQLRLRGFVQFGAELRERGQFAILRQVQAQSSGHLPHGFDLRVAADAAHR